MPDDEELRKRLAEALGERLQVRNGMSERAVMRLAEHLLPVVERYATGRAAEALREAADDPDWTERGRAELNRRADALAADGTEPRPAHRQDETEAGR